MCLSKKLYDQKILLIKVQETKSEERIKLGSHNNSALSVHVHFGDVMCTCVKWPLTYTQYLILVLYTEKIWLPNVIGDKIANVLKIAGFKKKSHKADKAAC